MDEQRGGDADRVPGHQAQIDDIFAAEDRVAVRLTFRGTHRGEFLGIAPTGRDVVFMSLEHYRVVDGQLAEVDLLGSDDTDATTD